MRAMRPALLAVGLWLACLDVPRSHGQNGQMLIAVVDDLAPMSWSDSRGHHCPPDWHEIMGMPLCKHVSTFNRSSAGGQRVLEDVTVVTVGRACPQAYRKLGDSLCARFGAVSTTDVYTVTADISYGGAYANASEGSAATVPTCPPKWELVSHPYEGGIGICLRRVTLLIQAPDTSGPSPR